MTAGNVRDKSRVQTYFEKDLFYLHVCSTDRAQAIAVIVELTHDALECETRIVCARCIWRLTCISLGLLLAGTVT